MRTTLSLALLLLVSATTTMAQPVLTQQEQQAAQIQRALDAARQSLGNERPHASCGGRNGNLAC